MLIGCAGLGTLTGDLMVGLLSGPGSGTGIYGSRACEELRMANFVGSPVMIRILMIQILGVFRGRASTGASMWNWCRALVCRILVIVHALAMVGLLVLGEFLEIRWTVVCDGNGVIERAR